MQQVDRLLFVLVPLVFFGGKVSLADVDLSLLRLKLILDLIWVTEETDELIKHVVKLLVILDHAMLLVLSLMMVLISAQLVLPGQCIV